MAGDGCDRRRSRVSRRELLRVGSLGLMGVSLPKLLEAEALAEQEGVRRRANACVVLFLNGGPSHHDMWDMKPNAPAAIRGEFHPISTSLSGYQLSDQLPRLSSEIHRATVVRSMHHGVNNSHAAAVYASLTGHDRGELGGGAKPDDNPTPGAVVSMLRPPESEIVPQVHLPYITKEGAKGPPQPGFFGGYLGRSHDPLFVLRDPNAADFSIPELTLYSGVTADRLSAREKLFDRVNQTLSTKAGLTAADQMNRFQRRALGLLTSKATQQAFRIDDEPANVRERYGRNIYGQSTLLARRLIEAGTRMVTLSWAPDANATWDTHGNNFNSLKKRLLPQFDAACTSLIQDFAERNLLERTLIVVLGDFGRTPKINKNAGRDHWNYCYSLMLVGGGAKPGLVYGESDKIGGYPKKDPLIPGDVISTVYHLLGIRHDRALYDRLNRPHRLVPTGDVVNELIV